MHDALLVYHKIGNRIHGRKPGSLRPSGETGTYALNMVCLDLHRNSHKHDVKTH